MPGNAFDDGEDSYPATLVSRGAGAGPRAHGLALTVVSGPDAGAVVTVDRPSAMVGRGAGADLRLTDPTASAFHVELATEPDGVSVRDLRSRNGTRYAGARLAQAVVPSGALLEIGRSVVRVELGGEIADDATGAAQSFGELSARSPAMRALFATLARLARTDLTVLIEGPTGCGKELTARSVHAASRFRDGPFVVLDCTAIPAALAESVLFGHEKGAFTGAAERRAGVFEAAAGGTVFLDEIGELPSDLQPKLLRVLERREVVRVGGTQPRPIDLRVLSATWRDLRTMINEGRFREDLYYRLAQSRVAIPPLRERSEDIPLLIQQLLERLPAAATAARSIAPDALAELLAREYPGNVRELKSVVERAALMADGPVITQADLAFERMLLGERARETPVSVAVLPDARPSLPPLDPSGGVPLPFKDAKRTLIEEFERDYLRRLLARTGGNVSRAAALAGIERHHLHNLARKHGLGREEG